MMLSLVTQSEAMPDHALGVPGVGLFQVTQSSPILARPHPAQASDSSNLVYNSSRPKRETETCTLHCTVIVVVLFPVWVTQSQHGLWWQGADYQDWSPTKYLRISTRTLSSPPITHDTPGASGTKLFLNYPLRDSIISRAFQYSVFLSGFTSLTPLV